MMPMTNDNAWLHGAAGRLQSDGFVPVNAGADQRDGFAYVARRTRFQITKFGMDETFFVFAETPGLTSRIMAEFSSAAFRFALRSKVVPLPCGLFESVWCFAVAVTSHLNPQLSESIRTTTPPKHWAAAEIPVVFDTTTGQLSYFEKTPMWGAAYYAGFRRQIKNYLG
jgi:hypothetical protein